MGALRDHLDGALGPGHVEVSSTTGSVLVRYDQRSQSKADIVSILRDVGVVIEETARGVGLEVPGQDASTTSMRIVNALSDLDRQLSVLTGQKIDLKLLFPLTLGGLGLWRAATAGLGLNNVPAYVMLWYAFDSFWKFHKDTAPPSNDGRNGQAAARSDSSGQDGGA
jgi:hypothetical protein